MGFGIDLGATALKVVRVQRTMRGFRLVGAARAHIPAGDGRKAEAAQALREITARTNKGIGVVGLGGRDVNLQVVQQSAMPAANYRAMMGYELEQKRGTEGELYGDFTTLREPDPYNPGYLAMVGVAKKEYVDARTGIASACGIDVRDAVPTPFALFAAYSNAYGVENGVVLLLDIGAENTDLALVRGGRLIFCRNVGTGSAVIDQGIARLGGLSAEEAESRKIRFANLGQSADEADPREDEIRPAVRSGASQIAGTIQSSLSFARGQLGEKDLSVDKIYLSGGGARLRGLSQYLQSALKIPVEILDPFKGVDLGPFAEEPELQVRPSDLTAALGLAQISADTKSSASTLSILPDSIKVRRNFFQGPAFLVAAGIVMAVGLVAVTTAAVIRRSKASAALKTFQDETREVDNRIKKLNDAEETLRTLIAKWQTLDATVTPGRGMNDAIAKLRKTLPEGVHIKAVKLVNLQEDRGHMLPPERVVFSSPGRGIVEGVIPSRKSTTSGAPEKLMVRVIKNGMRGELEEFTPDMMEGVVKVAAPWLAVQIEGEIDDRIKGGTPQAVLDGLKLDLDDPSRGVVTELIQEGAGSRPGWQVFKIILQFE
jgi:type IV pilus assembly protein PilM